MVGQQCDNDYMATTAHFQIVYDGPALDANEMDVNDLAPALLALSKLLEESNQLINEGKAKVDVRVKGSFTSGSFGVDFSVLQSSFDILNLFNDSHLTGALNLVASIGLASCAGSCLLKVLKWLKGRPIEKVVKVNDDTVEIYTQQESLQVSLDVLKLLMNFNVRRYLEKVVLPLRKEGIDHFYVKENGTNVIEIKKDEVDYFNAPIPQEEVLEDVELITNVQLVNVAFQETNKWRFSDGTTSFFATVEDNNFIQRVQNDTETFAKNDILRVKLRKLQYESPTGIRTEYYVQNVLEHRRPGLQLKLPMQLESEGDK
jgi:hypothetical protein